MKVDFARDFRMVTNERAKCHDWYRRVLRWNKWIWNIEKASKKSVNGSVSVWSKTAHTLDGNYWKTVKLWIVVFNHHSAWARSETCILKLMSASCVQSLNKFLLMCVHECLRCFMLRFVTPRTWNAFSARWQLDLSKKTYINTIF